MAGESHMTTNIGIRVIEPDEKLLIAIPEGILSENHMKHIGEAVQKFRDDDNLLIINGMDIYVVKDGKQVLLKDEIEIMTQNTTE